MCSAQFWGSLARLQVCPLTGVLRREAVKRKVPNAHFKNGFVIENSRERSWVPPDLLPIGQPLGNFWSSAQDNQTASLSPDRAGGNGYRGNCSQEGAGHQGPTGAATLKSVPLSPEWIMVASAFCPPNSGDPERERGDLGAHGGREEFRGLGEEEWDSGGSGREKGVLGLRKEERNPGGPERKSRRPCQPVACDCVSCCS